jgi:hypothetical protein
VAGASRSANERLTGEVVVACWLVAVVEPEPRGDPVVVGRGSAVVDRAVWSLDVNGFVVDVAVADGLVASALLTRGT